MGARLLVKWTSLKVKQTVIRPGLFGFFFGRLYYPAFLQGFLEKWRFWSINQPVVLGNKTKVLPCHLSHGLFKFIKLALYWKHSKITPYGNPVNTQSSKGKVAYYFGNNCGVPSQRYPKCPFKISIPWISHKHWGEQVNKTACTSRTRVGRYLDDQPAKMPRAHVTWYRFRGRYCFMCWGLNSHCFPMVGMVINLIVGV